MADWVLAVERAYAAAGTSSSAPPVMDGAAPRAAPAAGAVASRYLAVGTPRSFGVIADTASHAEAGALSLEAHRTWFQPSDVRCAGAASADLASRTGGRATSVAEAFACDIVCVHASMRLEARALRRGTHVNVLERCELDAELRQLAVIVPEEPGLAQLAAGLVDGRQLDELTLFVLGSCSIARAAVTRT